MEFITCSVEISTDFSAHRASNTCHTSPSRPPIVATIMI